MQLAIFATRCTPSGRWLRSWEANGQRTRPHPGHVLLFLRSERFSNAVFVFAKTLTTAATPSTGVSAPLEVMHGAERCVTGHRSKARLDQPIFSSSALPRPP